MDIETIRIEDFITTMSNLPEPLGFTNSVLINIHEVIKEYLIEEESGLTTLIGSYINPTSRILLRPLNFDLPHLSVLLHHELNRDLLFCRFLAANIAFSVEVNSLHQRPFLISVNVIINKEVRFISQPVVSVSMTSGATRDVLERLLKEQKVESFDLDETCSICIDKLLETSSEIQESNIIQMPNCLHLFHQDCIFEWLSRQNSCPLCRRVPYKEEDQD